jgi:hypothetical protein
VCYVGLHIDPFAYVAREGTRAIRMPLSMKAKRLEFIAFFKIIVWELCPRFQHKPIFCASIGLIPDLMPELLCASGLDLFVGSAGSTANQKEMKYA